MIRSLSHTRSPKTRLGDSFFSPSGIRRANQFKGSYRVVKNGNYKIRSAQHISIHPPSFDTQIPSLSKNSLIRLAAKLKFEPKRGHWVSGRRPGPPRRVLAGLRIDAQWSALTSHLSMPDNRVLWYRLCMSFWADELIGVNNLHTELFAVSRRGWWEGYERFRW